MPNRPTAGLARNSSLPGVVGLCAADVSRVYSLLNEAQEKLVMDPLTPDEGWWGGSAVMAFTVVPVNQAAYIITPREVARPVAFDVCKRPIPMRNGLWEYLEFGTGLHPRGCGANCASGCGGPPQAFERDPVPCLNPLPATPQVIRCYFTNAADAGRRVVIQGSDANGMTIYGVDPLTQTATQGEVIYLAGPFADSLNQIIPTGFIKEATLGPVQFFTIDASGNQTLLSTMQPGETTASYRRYLIDGLPSSCCLTPGGAVKVSAYCRLDFVPVQNDQDPLSIQSIPALIEECQSIRYSRMDSAQAPALEKKHHDKALALLNGQLDAYQGKIIPAVRVSLFGSDRLRRQPI